MAERLHAASTAAVAASTADTPRGLASLLAISAYGAEGSEAWTEDFLPVVEEALQVGGFAGQGIGGLVARIGACALAALAESGPGAFPKEVAVWTPGGGPRRVAYSALQCRGLLANAILMNVEDTCAMEKSSKNSGGLDFRCMLSGRSTLGAHKFACLLRYIDASSGSEDDDAREVVVERRAAPPGMEELADFKRWVLARDDAEAAPAVCVLHGEVMEAATDADAFVNFANPNFGYGRFINSCTQEEILQVCCPDFNVGMLHQGLMRVDEVVNVHGVRRFSSYTGYGGTFRYAGPWTSAPEVQSILTLDATMDEHFTEEMVLRDVRKAYLSFQGCRIVSTGRWGCGAFRGSPPHKLAQQVLAASLAGVELRFSSFGELDECDTILGAVEAAGPTPARLLQAILRAEPTRSAFARSFAARLGSPSADSRCAIA